MRRLVQFLSASPGYHINLHNWGLQFAYSWIATNSCFLIPLSLQHDGVNLWYFKFIYIILIWIHSLKYQRSTALGFLIMDYEKILVNLINSIFICLKNSEILARLIFPYERTSWGARFARGRKNYKFYFLKIKKYLRKKISNFFNL